MTTKPHPTDARQMPEPVNLLLTVNTGVSVHEFELNREVKFYDADQIRAERIAAWKMGRNAVLQEFAEAFEQEAEKSSDDSIATLLLGMAADIRKGMRK